jgi:hypothetical protein
MVKRQPERITVSEAATSGVSHNAGATSALISNFKHVAEAVFFLNLTNPSFIS